MLEAWHEEIVLEGSQARTDPPSSKSPPTAPERCPGEEEEVVKTPQYAVNNVPVRCWMVLCRRLLGLPSPEACSSGTLE